MRHSYLFVGAYGRKHRPAFVGDIGHLFYGEEVEYDDETKMIHFRRPGMEPVAATARALDTLRGPEFRHELLCAHRDGNGNRCASQPAVDSPYCAFHKKVHAYDQGPLGAANKLQREPLPKLGDPYPGDPPDGPDVEPDAT